MDNLQMADNSQVSEKKMKESIRKDRDEATRGENQVLQKHSIHKELEQNRSSKTYPVFRQIRIYPRPVCFQAR